MVPSTKLCTRRRAIRWPSKWLIPLNILNNLNQIQVPVDTDLQEIIKEITIMQQCDSRYVVKYYGSYFKDSDLWVCFLFI